MCSFFEVGTFDSFLEKKRRFFSKESGHSIFSDQYPGPEAISTSSNRVIARIFESPVETREMLVFCLRQLVDIIIRAGFTLSASLGPYILAPCGAGVGRYVSYL